MNDGSINSPTRGRRTPEFVQIHENDNDRKLLRRFVVRRDEAAFAALVERHAPMVQAVCRRVLRDAHEAEDACQATFLVLARKAGGLRRPELLANWLYGVAYRSARKAQRQLLRHSAHTTYDVAKHAAEPTPEVVWRDLRPVLDAELDRLPGKYRNAVVMCYLEGATTEDAARHLGCPRGTILSRLARGRERLRKRLVRRGLVLSTGILGLLLAKCASAATPLTRTFIQCTAKAAPLFADGRWISPEIIPKRSVEIANAMLRDMRGAKLMGIAICLMGVAIIILGVGWGLHRATPRVGAQAQPGPGNDLEQAKDIDPKKDPVPKDDMESIQGAWRGVTMHIPGQAPVPGDTITFKFTGDKVTIDCNLVPGQPFNPTFFFRLNSKADPKTLDMFSLDENKKEVLGMIGIYELDGDTLRLCTVLDNGQRPEQFVAKDAQMIWEFKREPAGKKPELPKNP
jgi:RNA polymerase sigma factor (sigma-70 family)